MTAQALKQELVTVWTRKPSLTTDLWTSVVGDKFLIVTLHFIDKSWQLQMVSLGTIHFPGTGDERDAAAVANVLRYVTIER